MRVMWRPRRFSWMWTLLGAVLACTGGGGREVPAPMQPSVGPTVERLPSGSPSAIAPSAPTEAPAPPSPFPDDGDDEIADLGSGDAPRKGTFTAVGRTPYSLERICDLTSFGNSLYIAYARRPLDWDGAVIQRYTEGETPPFRMAFNWNRVGEPTKGGGGGQGFIRIRRADGRLLVPDADPPYAGFGLRDYGAEGYVFVSDKEGAFAPPTQPHARPPGLPSVEGKAGAAILPRAYHVIDVIQYRGHLYASTGSVPPKERAWSGPSPGALHVADAKMQVWSYTLGYPVPYQPGVYRLTFMVRFRGRLYAGIQDYDGVDPNAYVVLEAPPGRDVLEQGDLRAVSLGGVRVNTLKWYVDKGASASSKHVLYWLTLERGVVHLRRSDDGDAFTEVDLPASMGRANDIVRYRDGLFVLGEHELVRIDGNTPVVVAAAPKLPQKGKGKNASPTTPFALTDIFCQSPLAVHKNKLYAGAQNDGTLYRLDDGRESVPETP